MFAGNPLRIKQRQRAWLDWNGQSGTEHIAGSVCGVHVQFDAQQILPDRSHGAKLKH